MGKKSSARRGRGHRSTLPPGQQSPYGRPQEPMYDNQFQKQNSAEVSSKARHISAANIDDVEYDKHTLHRIFGIQIPECILSLPGKYAALIINVRMYGFTDEYEKIEKIIGTTDEFGNWIRLPYEIDSDIRANMIRAFAFETDEIMSYWMKAWLACHIDCPDDVLLYFLEDHKKGLSVRQILDGVMRSKRIGYEVARYAIDVLKYEELEDYPFKVFSKNFLDVLSEDDILELYHTVHEADKSMITQADNAPEWLKDLHSLTSD